MVGEGRLVQGGDPPRPGVQPPEPPLTGLEGDVGGEVAVELADVVAHVDLSVVGGDDQGRPGGSTESTSPTNRSAATTSAS